MSTRTASSAAWLLYCIAFSAPAHAASLCDPTPDARAILGQYDGLASHCEPSPGTTGGILTFYGVPMTEGVTPEEAVANWIDAHAGAIGMSPADLQVARNPFRRTSVDSGRFTVFAYQQHFFGFPVEGSLVRFLVLNGKPNRVVYVSAWVRDLVGAAAVSSEIVVDAPRALALVRDSRKYGHLTEWSTPSLVILVGEADDRSRPIPAWKFRGRLLDGAGIEALTFYVDAFEGGLIRVEDDLVASETVTGVVRGFVTPGTFPDVPYNPPEIATLSGVRVGIVESGVSTNTDAGGHYAIVHSGDWPVAVEATLGGERIEVVDERGCPVLERALDVAPPDLWVDLLLNDGPVDGCAAEPNEFSTAQLNALMHGVKARDFFLTHQPDFAELTSRGGSPVHLTMHVNHADPTDPCNARFAPPDAFFFRPGDETCTNMAYSSVVAHEYGHFVVDALKIGQWSFGEGFADALAILVYDDPVVGRDYKGAGGHMRDIASSDVPYPCPSISPHYCGQTLARLWWDLRVGLGDATGDPAAGLEAARRLYTSWALIAGGVPASLSESATPQTAIEMTVIDDDDGHLGNGTPHVCVLCAALVDRNIPCPPVIPDEDGDGLPDACARDCNGNGVPDFEDLSSGASFDCNGNGVPDECDVPPIGSGIDCDGDLVPDECQLAEHDCNGNGVLDECDVVAGTSPDENRNRIPDECECPDLGCYDGDVCTWDRLENGACVHDPNAYGDVNHTGGTNLLDLIAIVGAVGQTDECAIRAYDISPCEGDGVITMFDVIGALNAMRGADACCGGNP